MAKDSITEYLSKQEILSGLDPDFTQFIASCAKEKRVEKGAVLFRRGDKADRFFLVRSGSLTIEIPAIQGPSLEVQRLGPDKILGWSWLIPPYRWSFQAKAQETSDVIEFDGAAIVKRCEEEPKLGYEMMKRFTLLMSERIEASRQKMMDEWNPPGFA